jgi:cell division protein FtsL
MVKEYFERNGFVTTLAVVIPLLTAVAIPATVAIFKLGGNQTETALRIEQVNRFAERIKSEGTNICRLSQLTNVKVEGKVDYLNTQITDVQVDLKNLESKVDEHMRQQTEMQRQILEELRKVE